MGKIETKKGGEWVPPRIVIYGDAKSGKTSTAAEAPRPLYIGTDDGCRRLEVDYLEPPASWNEFNKQLDNIVEHAKGDGYQSIVTDTINGVVDLCAKHVCKQMYGGKWDDPKYGFLAWGGKGWNATSEEIRKLMSTYDRLRDLGLWVIFLAHQKTEKISSPTDGEYDRYSPAMDSRCWAPIEQHVDNIMRIDLEKSFTEDGSGKRHVVTDGKVRVLRCALTLSEIAGCRVGYELPDEIPLSWAAIEQHLGSTEVDLGKLLHEAIQGLDDDDAEKALEWLGVDDAHLDDVPEEKAKVLLGRLQSRGRRT